MIRSLYTAVSGMIVMENKQNAVSNNLANANTMGYKSEDLVTKSFDEVLIKNMSKGYSDKPQRQELGKMSLGVEIDTNITKFTEGNLQETNKYSDIAIIGRGFFPIQSGDQIFYSRDGQFRTNNQGYLVNNSGDYLLGMNNNTGALEPINVQGKEFVIDANNNIVVDGVPNYKLAVADFENYGSLEKAGNNYYAATTDQAIYINGSIQQGFLEGSNVNITNEMVNMMTVMRNFETSQKFVSMIDKTLDLAANKIGSV